MMMMMMLMIMMMMMMMIIMVMGMMRMIIMMLSIILEVLLWKLDPSFSQPVHHSLRDDDSNDDDDDDDNNGDGDGNGDDNDNAYVDDADDDDRSSAPPSTIKNSKIDTRSPKRQGERRTEGNKYKQRVEGRMRADMKIDRSGVNREKRHEQQQRAASNTVKTSASGLPTWSNS
jgi:hypothetical protein